jgi:hypothetical protein
MPYRLISHTKVPPGGFLYHQTDGVEKKFESTPLIHELAQKVSDFRKANNLERSDYLSCLEDIDAYNCQRLGNMVRFCYNTEQPFRESVRVPAKGGCGGCGAEI